ncbi:MAG: hypothetical protein M1155_00300, partial [Patescibacteria group bacterium]|nr:hypothetical protein [Patescibacteria group bacterium]
EFFGTWMDTPAGKTKTLKLEYKDGGDIKIANGEEFYFVYDKQSGVQGSLDYEIIAPPGYVWKESGRSIFSYGTEQIPARETIKLTLLKNNAGSNQ